MFDFAEIRSNLDVRVGRRFLGYAREEGPGREGGERPPGLRFWVLVISCSRIRTGTAE